MYVTGLYIRKSACSYSFHLFTGIVAYIKLLAGHSLIVQVMGVLGASVLCLHDPLDLVKGFVIDDLHCLFLGVTKHMLSLWFDKKYRSHNFYIGEKVLLNVEISQLFLQS